MPPASHFIVDDPLGQLTPAFRRPPELRWWWHYGPARALLLVLVLVLPALLQPLSEDAARRGWPGWTTAASVAPGTPNRLPDEPARRQAAPPSPSGANPPDHTFDGEPVDPGLTANADFETAGPEVGTPPANHDLATSPSATGTPPANHDVATGDFTGRTKAGTTTTTIQTTGGPDGNWARLAGSTSAITSDPFTVDTAAQAVTFDLGSLTTSGSAAVAVYALSGSGYGTTTLLTSFSCSACNAWSSASVGVSAYLGQSIKLKFARTAGTVGIDTVRQGSSSTRRG